jgi:hypothetical protein
MPRLAVQDCLLALGAGTGVLVGGACSDNKRATVVRLIPSRCAIADLKVLDDEQRDRGRGGRDRGALIDAEADWAAKAEVGATAKSKCEQGCFAGAPVEQDGGDVLTGLGVGEVGLAEGAWPVVGHARR